MDLHGLHILLTYQCLYECEHCFVWGSPRQTGTFSHTQLSEVIQQAQQAPNLEWIYFEGGEPFLFYPLLLAGIRLAHEAGYKVGVVTNGYWANNPSDARLWLAPLAGMVQDLSVSTDLYHDDSWLSPASQNVQQAAAELDIPVGTISVAYPDQLLEEPAPCGVAKLMYRGRATAALAPHAELRSWQTFTECPDEDLVEPGRLHLDPFGNLHICQGILIGNLFTEKLASILARYEPFSHPICGPLLMGGPAGLARRYATQPQTEYADACHLCYATREILRPRFPLLLAPDQVYGEIFQ